MQLSITGSRSSGVLLHISSLPSPHGIGDLGKEARDFIDTLEQGGQRWWQILPLNPPAAGDSPYSSHSAMAGNPLLIDPDWLVEHRLLERREAPTLPPGKVRFAEVHQKKHRMVAISAERFARARGRLGREFERFCAETPWLEDYSLYMALRERFGRPWQQWPRDLALRKPAALKSAQSELAADIHRHRFSQFVFATQLAELRAHAALRKVHLIGDMPIFVASDSADVWANRSLFQLDSLGRPKVVSGVPPDLFSATGQLWGNPLYDWRAMQATGYRWWLDRLRAVLTQVDVIRIDHFRGLRAYWEIPGRAKTARRGRWVRAPGEKLLAAIAKEFASLPLLAEDLGVITPDVDQLRDDFELPGMRVIQFAFGGDARDLMLVHNHPRKCVVYTGTHDNDTTLSWYRNSDRETRRRVASYVPDVASDPAWALMRYAMSSVADVVIVPAQDVLSLGSEARMNMPGVGAGNWSWRLKPGQSNARTTDRLRELTERYARA